jgi:ADP-heptose:LPS heptosyltransferase
MRRNSVTRPLFDSLARAVVSLERFVRPAAGDPNSVRNVLVFQYIVPLGNCVHMTPLFEAIKRDRPDVRITVATWGIGAQVLRNCPYIDDLLETPSPLTGFWGAVSSVRDQLRSLGLKPDCCLTGASDHRSKIALSAAAACSGWRGGYTLLPALYQKPLLYDRGISLIDNNLRLAELLGISAQLVEPRVFYSPEDAAMARSLLEPARIEGRPVLVAVTRNSGGLPTGWHDDRWSKTLRYAHQELGYEIFYAGTASDAPAIAALMRMTGEVGISLAGKTTINQLAALLALSDMVITLTTGTMHMTRAVGTPMVVLNVAWEKPLEWMPSDRPSVRVLRGPDLDTIPPEYRMDEISVEWACSELADMSRLFEPDRDAQEARLKANLSDVDHLRL